MGLFSFLNKEKKENDWTSILPKEYVALLLGEIKKNPQACREDEILQGFGKFGLEPSNPIPVYGVPSNETYLNSLRTLTGERLRWRRIGSLQVENIVSPIDKYEIFNSAGDTICFIYISPYHWRNSKKAPEGFKMLK